MKSVIIATHVGVVEDDDLDAVLGEPVVPAVEGPGLADDEPGDAELTHQPAAEPAGRERRDHRRAAVGALPPGPPERVRLAVHRGVVVLDAPVVAAAEQRAVGGEQRGADRDAALGEPGPGLLERDGQQLAVGRAAHATTRLRAARAPGAAPRTRRRRRTKPTTAVRSPTLRDRAGDRAGVERLVGEERDRDQQADGHRDRPGEVDVRRALGEHAGVLAAAQVAVGEDDAEPRRDPVGDDQQERLVALRRRCAARSWRRAARAARRPRRRSPGHGRAGP